MKKIVFNSLTFLVIFLSISAVYSQTKTDSLLRIIDNSTEAEKLQNIYNLLNFLIKTNPEEVYKYSIKLKQYDSENKNDTAICKYYHLNGLANFKQGIYDKSKLYYDSAITIAKQINLKSLIADLYISYANIYEDIGENKKCIENYISAEKIYTELNDQFGIANSTNNLGITYGQNEDFDNALFYFYKSYNANLELNNKHGIGNTLNNIGNVLGNQNKYDSAITCLNMAITTWEEINEKRGVAMSSNGLGRIYSKIGDYNKALYYINKSLNISEEQNDLFGQTQNLLSIAEVYSAQGKHELSIKINTQALELAKKMGNIRKMSMINRFLYKSKYELGDYKSAVDHLLAYTELKDSLISVEKTKAIEEMRTKYESEKKELQINNLEKDNKLKENENQKQRIIIYTFIIGLVIIIIFSIFLYRLFLQKKAANKIILNKNIALEQANEEISSQRDEIEAQRDVVVKQKEQIEEIHSEVTDSINYAKRIQEAVLPVSIQSRTVLGEHFILFRPKDIVSGDFYWVAKIENTLIVAVADCTGHGVPGAFMSMLGISFLNEIVRKKEILKASEALNELRKEIINALQQTGSTGEQKDGMDMSLVVIMTQAQSSKNQISSSKLQDEEGNQYSVSSKLSADERSQNNNLNETSNLNRACELNEVKLQTSNVFNAQWAGANNPLWIVRSDETLTGFKTLSEFSEDASANNEQRTTTELASSTKLNHKLFELKPDKMPIAIYEKMDSFTNHEIQLYSGDCIYLMSDGYQDQFGGTKFKKFLSKNLKQLLIDNCQLPMDEQKQILEKTLVEWIGDGEQIDDITVVGIKI